MEAAGSAFISPYPFTLPLVLGGYWNNPRIAGKLPAYFMDAAPLSQNSSNLRKLQSSWQMSEIQTVIYTEMITVNRKFYVIHQ